MNTETQKSRVLEFIDLYYLGYESWTQAGKIVAEELDKNPNFAEQVCALSKGNISVSMVKTFEKFGRGLVLPQLMMDYGNPGIRKLVEMPIHIQEYYIKHPVELLIFTDDGQVDTLLVQVRNLTRDQLKQVFGTNSVLSREEQRAVVESQRKKAQLKAVAEETFDSPVVFDGDLIHFTRPCRFTLAELYIILANRKQ